MTEDDDVRNTLSDCWRHVVVSPCYGCGGGPCARRWHPSCPQDLAMNDAEQAELEEVRAEIAELEQALAPLRRRERELEQAIWGGPPAFFHKQTLE